MYNGQGHKGERDKEVDDMKKYSTLEEEGSSLSTF